MKECDDLFNYFSVSPPIAAKFLKDFDYALSFKLRSAHYCSSIGSPLPISWCRDSAVEIGRRMKTARDVKIVGVS